MTQQETDLGLHKEITNYKDIGAGDHFSALIYFAIKGAGDGISGGIPSDQQAITEGIKVAVGSAPQIHSIIDSRGQLAFEAIERLEKLKAEGIVVENNGRLQFGDKQKVTDTLGSGPNILYTPEGINLLKEAAAAAREFWYPSAPQEPSV